MKINIGITDCGKYHNYESWFRDEADVQVIRLSYHDNSFSNIEQCDGILLTGGEDMHPGFYDSTAYLAYSSPENMDLQRDEFEWKVLQYVESSQLPLLGICRGLQVANVFFGGTLVPDLPSFGKPDHAKIKGVTDRYHAVQVMPGTLLQEIIGTKEGEINSAHHQSVAVPGKGLTVNAVSKDGIIEGMESNDAAGKPYLLLVQWHPERMTDQQSVFAKNIKDNFLAHIREIKASE